MLAMESLLGFKETVSGYDVLVDNSHSFKLVPWMTWDEWKFVQQSLFSSSPDCIASALRRIVTWRSRGCTPVAIEITASIVEIRQKDPFFGNNLLGIPSPSDEMLAMLYCMAIMRLVNGVVEKSRKKNEISIGEAADAIGIPRMLIDIRHEGSHRDLPSLQLLRLASDKALNWLVSYYWEPQERAIPIQSEQAVSRKKEIKRRLREVMLCIKEKQMAKLDSSHVKDKHVRQSEALCGRRKFLLLATGKGPHSNAVGLKKKLTKSLKNILRLYASSSAEVVYTLLEYLLNALDSSNPVEQLEDSQSADTTENKQTTFNHWKSVVLKLSSKEPEFLLVITHAILEKMESERAASFQADGLFSPNSSVSSQRAELLSCLFSWLIENLKTFQKASTETNGSKTGTPLPKATVLGLLGRCLLLLPCPGNKQLMSSAITLAQMTGDTSLLHKLKKLAGVNLQGDSIIISCDETPNECYPHEAEAKFEACKLLRIQKKEAMRKQSVTSRSKKWTLMKSWNACPIGMLPDPVGFSGQFPVLDRVEVCVSDEGSPHGKRGAESRIEEIDTTPVKKTKETKKTDSPTIPNQTNTDDDDEKGIKGHIIIDGTWKKVGEDELEALTSSVRLLI